jgi:outer membrane protein insertion porin family
LVTDDALGGSTFWATTAEVRFPLPLIPDDLGMSGAVFVDAGSLFGAGAFAKGPINNQCGAAAPNPALGICLADDSSIRASAGFSLIWNSPLGPLRLDIAKAFLKKDFDDEQLIRFGASTKF